MYLIIMMILLSLRIIENVTSIKFFMELNVHSKNLLPYGSSFSQNVFLVHLFSNLYDTEKQTNLEHNCGF